MVPCLAPFASGWHHHSDGALHVAHFRSRSAGGVVTTIEGSVEIPDLEKWSDGQLASKSK